MNVLGVGVSAINMTMALEEIDDWVRNRERHYICVCPVHSIMECQRSAEVRQVFNGAGMVTPDGMPLVWVARAGGHPEVSRVYGPDLMLAELDRSSRTGHRHFFYERGAARRCVGRYELAKARPLDGADAPASRRCGFDRGRRRVRLSQRRRQTGSVVDAALRSGVGLQARDRPTTALAPVPGRQPLVLVGARTPEDGAQEVRAGLSSALRPKPRHEF